MEQSTNPMHPPTPVDVTEAEPPAKPEAKPQAKPHAKRRHLSPKHAMSKTERTHARAEKALRRMQNSGANDSGEVQRAQMLAPPVDLMISFT